MLWSILIAAIPSRYHSAQPLLFSLLEAQGVARRPDVELLYLMDNKRRPVGEKRNALLSMAQGEYLTFVDDDDQVAPNYVEKILGAITKARRNGHPVDVICFPQRATLQPANIIHECTYSLAHYRQRPPEQRRQLATTGDPNALAWSGPPAHTMAWRTALVRDLPFPEKNFGEDSSWCDQASERAQTELCLDGGPLYFYNFNEQTSETR